MKIYSFVLALGFVGLVASCSQSNTINLGGVWQSSLGECSLPGTTDENKLGDGNQKTNVTSQLTRLYPYSGKVSYEKEIVLPKSMVDKHMTLVMERTKPSTLWVDGEQVGSIRQLCAPHEYELPELTAGPHTIKIEIDNSPMAVSRSVQGSHAWTDATQTNWNGILGRFCITATPHTYIKNVKTYPDLERKGVLVKVSAVARNAGEAKFQFSCGRKVTRKVLLAPGENLVEEFIPLGKNIRTWSEFHPNLYELRVSVRSEEGKDSKKVRFGMREFATDGTQFTINGFKTFLRGTHDGCVFPLTGYAPTDVDEWRRMFSIAKQYGINHYRFHSYTPPEAAFEAADLEGIYLQVELPLWGRIDAFNVRQNDFLRNEAFTTLEFLGNHPSFMALGLGNELGGNSDLMNAWLDDFRAVDDRHLYVRGSNNNLGWSGPKDGEDFYVTCRVGGSPNPDSDEEWVAEINEKGFGSHARTSFSFADADNGGILNALRPNTLRSFKNVVPLCGMPIVSHESGQFQIYPDYKDLPKYTGVLYPYNLEIFRDRLSENGLTGQIEDFHRASGLWAVECYKADMEYCLRTPGFGGYQLLDIKDYPGQGTALVGILDAFMDSKGLTTAEEFSQWNSAVVPMAEMRTYCWSSDEELEIDVVLSNYEENNYARKLTWKLEGPELGSEGVISSVNVPQGDVARIGTIKASLASVTRPQQVKLELKTGKYSNTYTVWVYPALEDADIAVLSELNDSTMNALLDGASVLLSPSHDSIEGASVGGLFTPDYWNYAMFKTISENNRKPVSPGTLGMLMDKEHPLFDLFPTDGYSNWQWWSVALNSRPLILDGLDKSYFPVIQTVDNVERNHKLGVLMEFKVGKGRLLICTTDLRAISQYVEGRWYAKAISAYMASERFNPSTEITESELNELLHTVVSTREIHGVRNISDYKAPNQ